MEVAPAWSPGPAVFVAVGASELSHLFSDCAIRNMVAIDGKKSRIRRSIGRTVNLPKKLFDSL